MALVNPNIALGIQPVQLADPMAQYGKIAAIQSAQNQNALAQYQLGAAKRGEETQNVLAQAYAQSVDPDTGKIDYNKLTKLVATGGGGAQLPAIQKSRLDQESANTELLTKKLALLPEAYKRADTPEAYLKLHQSVHADPVIGPWLMSTGATPEKGLATLQNAVQTGKFDDLRVKSMQSVSQILEGMKPQVVAPGSSLVQGGKAIFTAPAAPAAPTNLAKLQGEMAALPPGDPRRAQYEALIRKETTHAPAVSITNVAEKAEAGEFGKMLIGQYSDISKAAGLAAKTLPAIESNLSALNKGLDTGFGTEAKAAGAKILGALGVKDAEKYATDTQTFQSNAIQAVMQKQLEQKGPQTESDAQRIEQIGAQLGKTKAANEFILSVAREQLRRDMAQRDFYTEWKKGPGKGSFNGAEDAWFASEGNKSLFDRPALKKFAVSSTTPAQPTPSETRPSLSKIFSSGK